MDIPDSTNYGIDVIEVCRKAFPQDMACKICKFNILPQFLFIFSCGHYYHAYCASLMIGKENPFVKCKRCTLRSSKKDRKRLSRLPQYVMQFSF